MFYLHPWELDPEQPRVDIRYQYRFRHYVNLGKTEKRLARLLKDFRFGTIRDVVLQHFPELNHGGLNA